MPALRERQEDVPVLVDATLKRLCGEQPPVLLPEARQALVTYPYPGNVRELENILERATALCVDGQITPEDLQLADTDVEGAAEAGGTLDEQINRFERQLILEALSKTGDNRTAAARLLGVTFRSLRYRIERLGIDP